MRRRSSIDWPFIGAAAFVFACLAMTAFVGFGLGR
jgi:hypothetical protein